MKTKYYRMIINELRKLVKEDENMIWLYKRRKEDCEIPEQHFYLSVDFVPDKDLSGLYSRSVASCIKHKIAKEYEESTGNKFIRILGTEILSSIEEDVPQVKLAVHYI